MEVRTKSPPNRRIGMGIWNMVNLSYTKLAVALGGLALSLPISVGVASAQPDLGPVINTTCTYDQVIAALNAQRPDLAQQFSQQPVGQAAVRSFLASPVSERQRTVAQLRGNPVAQQYLGAVLQIAGSCNNY